MRWYTPLVLAAACYVPPPAAAGPDSYGRAVRVHDPFGFKCSGVMVADERVLTAAHCLVPALYVEGLPVTRAVPNASMDAAVLDVPGLHGPAAALGSTVGDELVLMGFGCSGGRNLSVRAGTIHSRNETELTTDIEGCFGDSGGPVYSGGLLIGIVRARVLETGRAVVRLLD